MSLHNQSYAITVGKRVAEISSLCDNRPPPRSEEVPTLSQTGQLWSFTQPLGFTVHIYRAVTSLLTPQLPLLSQDSVSHQVNNRKQGNQNRGLVPLQARRQLKGSAEDCGFHDSWVPMTMQLESHKPSGFSPVDNHQWGLSAQALDNLNFLLSKAYNPYQFHSQAA